MQNLIRLREQLGITQANIAVYLSVSVSLIKMVEAGKRDLPSTALVKLAQLEEAALTTAAVEVALPPTADKAGSERTLSRYIRQLEKQVHRNEKDLLVMQHRYQQCQRKVALTGYLLEKMTAAEAATTGELWLQVVQADALAGLHTYGKAAQAIVQWKTDTCIYSVQKAKALLAGWK